MLDEGTELDPTGTWLAEVELPILWHNLVILRVEESVEVKGLVHRSRADGGGYVETFQLCGVTFPEFTTVGRSIHQVVIPNNTFDQGFFPTSLPYRAHPYADGDGLGLRSSPVALTGGVLLPDADALWPTPAALQSVDTDCDGYPGLTLSLKPSSGLQPLSIPGSTRPIGSVFAALRLRFQFNLGVVEDRWSEGDALWVGDGPEFSILGGLHVDGTALDAHEVRWLQHNVAMRAHESGHVAMRRVPKQTSPRAVREAE